jgi:hypothetical protein
MMLQKAGMSNMLVNNKDILTFYQPIDGRLRKVKYGAMSPIINLPCNACIQPTGDPNCYPVPLFPKTPIK